MIRLAIIGDVHNQFDQFDIDYFNQSEYQLILFVGDLANYRHREGVEMARRMARLEKPTLYIPGNHDGIHAFQLLAEIKQNKFWINQFAPGQRRRMRQLRHALGQVVCGGYSTHSYAINEMSFDVIVTRPFAMGGSQLSYQPHLERAYGIRNMAESFKKLKQCIDAAQSDTLLFLAHNGPIGVGTKRTDIWGCDFRDEEGDFGDEDLQLSVEYAKSRGKRVLALFAGHMHHQLKGGGKRVWHVESGGVHYVNAAHVPRIFERNGRSVHHHICFTFDKNRCIANQCFVDAV